jgi:hypothetical protein
VNVFLLFVPNARHKVDQIALFYCTISIQIYGHNEFLYGKSLQQYGRASGSGEGLLEFPSFTKPILIKKELNFAKIK